MRADKGEHQTCNIGNVRRVELRAATTELLYLDLRISRLETVLKLLLTESSGRVRLPSTQRVEPHRSTC